MIQKATYFSSKNVLKALVLIIVVYAIIEKILLYSKFSVNYTDEDQCILWLAADELLHGHFREPCFFGQDYSSCLEGWFSVPFLIAGLDYNQAIPLTTLLMSVFPFALIGWHFFKKENYLMTVITLFFLLMFSLNYKLISILPRGFITGVFFVGIAYYMLLREGKFRFFWFSFFALFGFFLNEMSVFLSFPILLIYFKDNYRSKPFYLQCIVGGLPALTYKLYAYGFYNIWHRQYKTFSKSNFIWEFNDLKEAFAHLDNWLFNDFTLIFISILFLCILLAFKKHYFKVWVIFIIVVLMGFSFGLHRMQEGAETIFFNKSRLFVFIPFLLVILSSFVFSSLSLSMNKQLLFSGIAFVFITVTFFRQQSELDKKIEDEINIPEKVVSVMSVENLYRLSYKYIYICRATHNHVLVFDILRKDVFTLYTVIPLLSDNDIKTFLPAFDRRLWAFNELVNSQPEKVVVFENYPERYNKAPLNTYKRRILDSSGDWLVEYYLKKPLGRTCKEDFKTRLRIH
ncbi:MAG: hypothetical protein V4506_01835 [Bacteroidota bacterium]